MRGISRRRFHPFFLIKKTFFFGFFSCAIVDCVTRMPHCLNSFNLVLLYVIAGIELATSVYLCLLLHLGGRGCGWGFEKGTRAMRMWRWSIGFLSTGNTQSERKRPNRRSLCRIVLLVEHLNTSTVDGVRDWHGKSGVGRWPNMKKEERMREMLARRRCSEGQDRMYSTGIVWRSVAKGTTVVWREWATREGRKLCGNCHHNPKRVGNRAASFFVIIIPAVVRMEKPTYVTFFKKHTIPHCKAKKKTQLHQCGLIFSCIH